MLACFKCRFSEDGCYSRRVSSIDFHLIKIEQVGNLFAGRSLGIDIVPLLEEAPMSLTLKEKELVNLGVSVATGCKP
jgi:alkylhydroperoxidase/carboxymuconolactone decarboxylase family protein YurZ